MKKYGTLMKPELAQATHDGTKTVTRRIMKPQPPGCDELYSIPGVIASDKGVFKRWECYWKEGDKTKIITAVTRVVSGQIRSIKETHWRWGRKGKNEKGNWKFFPAHGAAVHEILFEAPQAPPSSRESLGFHKYSALFMPFDLARTYIEILSVRPERLQDITGEEARLEGVTFEAVLKILANYDSADVRPHCWMHNHPDGAAKSYCDECIDKAVEAERKKYPDADIERDGGYDSHETEGVALCEICGRLLEYTLLEYGVESEVSQFEEYGFELSNPREAHELERIFIEADYIQDEALKDRVYRLGFAVLWDSINANRGYPWASNPWVWRYEYKRVERPTQ